MTLKTVIDKLFYQVQQLLLQCSELIFFTHIRAHSAFSGPLLFGNTTIDSLLYPIEAAKQEHLLHHSNSKGLQKPHAITRKQAQNIVRSCSICAPFALPFTPPGVNIRGLQANQIWQMDVIYISCFGQQKCVHHTIDTCTHFQWATTLHSKKADAVITHLLSCFAVMRLPIKLKPDNAPLTNPQN